jgi:hypothetical protein
MGATSSVQVSTSTKPLRLCSYHALRMMQAVRAHASLFAFLHGYLKEDVYKRPPRR